MAFDWTGHPEIEEKLQTLWSEGISCSRIAKALGHGLTRNAVISKVHRLGLAGRSTVSSMRKASEPRVQPKPRLVVVKAPVVPVVEEEPITLGDGSHITILTVTDRMCRWPIGDPAATEFHFCGRSPKSGSPYCEAHALRAYQPQQTAASRKKAESVDARVQDRQMRRMGQ